MLKRFSILQDGRMIRVNLDGEPIFERDDEISCWKYIHIVDNRTQYDMIPTFDGKYLQLFLEDILLQLEDGCNRNDLIINVPRRVILEDIQIGDRTVKRYF
jgi:hypothetical protein